MKKLVDISKVQDKMLKIGEEIIVLECITKSLNGIISYGFSDEEICYMAEIINEKAVQVHKKYHEVECELNI